MVITPSEQTLALRRVTDADLGFLAEVYASTRQEEVATTGWPAERIEAFLRMQFDAQHSHYQTHYADASFHVILCEDQPVGRLYVHRSQRELRIVDISLLPNWRGQGIGSYFLGKLIAEAQCEGQVVGIHVERNNPALTLYRRLGFEKREDKGVYLFLEKTVPSG